MPCARIGRGSVQLASTSYLHYYLQHGSFWLTAVLEQWASSPVKLLQLQLARYKSQGCCSDSPSLLFVTHSCRSQRAIFLGRNLVQGKSRRAGRVFENLLSTGRLGVLWNLMKKNWVSTIAFWLLGTAHSWPVCIQDTFKRNVFEILGYCISCWKRCSQ